MEQGMPEAEWLSVPEVAAFLQLEPREVRSLLAAGELLALRRPPNNAWLIPADLLVEDPEPAVLPGLRGSLTQLADAGFSSEESLAWLRRHNDDLQATPLQALRDLRTHAVRRAAQHLAF